MPLNARSGKIDLFWRFCLYNDLTVSYIGCRKIAFTVRFLTIYLVFNEKKTCGLVINRVPHGILLWANHWLVFGNTATDNLPVFCFPVKVFLCVGTCIRLVPIIVYADGLYT